MDKEETELGSFLKIMENIWAVQERLWKGEGIMDLQSR